MSVHSGPADWWTDGTDAGRTHIATKGIVQSGLILNLDAGVSTSYPGTGTTWTDLSGSGNHGTLTNGPTFSNNSLSFDGTNDYVVCAASSSFDFGTGDVSIDIWFNWDGTYVNTGRSLYATGGSASRDQFGIFQGAGVYFGGISNNVAANYPSTNQWCNVVVSKIGTTIKIYINSIETASGTQTLAIGSSSVPAYVGFRGADIAHPFKGSISSFKLYKAKGLSTAEIQKNFNATRGRFGI